MKHKNQKEPTISKYSSFDSLKSANKVSRKLTDEEALEKALELIDFFNTLKNAKPLN